MACLFPCLRCRDHSYRNLEDDEEEGAFFDFDAFVHSFALTWLDVFCLLIGITSTITIAICQTICLILLGRACGMFITYTRAIQHNSDHTSAENILQDEVNELTVRIIMIAIIVLILRYLGDLVFINFSNEYPPRFRHYCLKKIVDQNISWFDGIETSKFLSELLRHFANVQRGLDGPLMASIYHGTIFLSGIAFSFYLNWELALISIIAMPASLIVDVGINFIAGCCTGTASKRKQRDDKLSLIIENVTGSSEKLRENIMKGVLFLFSYTSSAVSICFGLHLIIGKRNIPNASDVNEISNVIAIVIMTSSSFWHLHIQLNVLKNLGRCLASLWVIRKLIHMNDSKIHSGFGWRPLKCLGGIVFHKVTHRLLEDLSFTIQPNEKVAVITDNSIIFDLILRFYDPFDGKIIVDGNDVRDLNLAWFRNQIGIVDRKPILFETTIYANIAFGRSELSYVDVQRAARRAGIHHFITRLPKSYESIIGHDLILGDEEYWRIGLARAFVRQPKILMIDARLIDIDIAEILDEIPRNCTCLIIVEDYQSVGNFDRAIDISQNSQQVNSGVLNEEESRIMVFPENGYIRFQEEEEVNAISFKDLLHLSIIDYILMLMGFLASTVYGATVPFGIILVTEAFGEMYIENNDILFTTIEPLCHKLIAVGVIAAFSYFFQIQIYIKLVEKSSCRMEKKIFATVINRNMNEENISFGMLFGSVKEFSTSFWGLVENFFVYTAMLVISILASLSSNVELTVMLLPFLLVTALVSYFKEKIAIANRRSTEILAEISNEILCETIQKIKTILSLGCGDMFLVRHDRSLNLHLEDRKASERALCVAIERSMMVFAFALAVYYGTKLVIANGIPFKIVIRISELTLCAMLSIVQQFSILTYLEIMKKSLADFSVISEN